MDEVTVVGDDLYFNAFKIGAKPEKMCATEWYGVVSFLQELSVADAESAYNDGYAEGEAAAKAAFEEFGER